MRYFCNISLTLKRKKQQSNGSVVQGRLSAGFWFHISTGPPSQHQVYLGPSQAVSSLWKNGVSSPIPTLPHSLQADYCQIQDPVKLPDWSRQAQKCRNAIIPVHLVRWINPCYWGNKAVLISRCSCVGVLPQRGVLALLSQHLWKVSPKSHHMPQGRSC